MAICTLDTRAPLKSPHSASTPKSTPVNRGEHDEKSGKNHLTKRCLGGDVDTRGVVGFHSLGFVKKIRVLGELSLNFLNHCSGSLTDRFHRHRGEDVWKHGTDDEEGEGDGTKHVDTVLLEPSDLGGEGTEKGKRHKGGRSDGETLADRSSGVTSSIEGVRLGTPC